MPFNINKFKSAMDRRGGVALESLFEVILTKNSTNADFDPLREFTFFCNAVTIPSISINTADYAPVGALPRSFPTTVSNDGLSCNILIDSDHEMIKFFHGWLQQVVNYSTSGGAYSEVDGRYPHEVGFKDDFSCTLTIRHYSTESFDDKYYEWKFTGVWPNAISDLDLAWNNNDSFLTSAVSFNYDEMQVTGEKTGSPTDGRRGRGGGFLDLLGRLGGLADTIRGIKKGGRPTSIQDAINRISRFRNAVGRVSDVI